MYGLLSEAGQIQPAPHAKHGEGTLTRKTLLRVLRKLNTKCKGETQKS